MNCPICDQPMKRLSWQLTNNGKAADEYQEYYKTTYQCLTDDVWVTTEIPIAN